MLRAVACALASTPLFDAAVSRTVSRLWISAAAFGALVAPAQAADLPPPVEIVPPPPLLSPAPIAFNWSGFYFGAHGGWGFGSGAFTDGAIAGGQVGVNWQYGRFVVGFEGEGSWVDWDEANVVGTGLGRAGVAFGRFHAYGAAGLAARDGVELFGWVAGGGAEYALTNNWTLGVEYLHYDFAREESEVVRGRVNYLFGHRSDQFVNGGIFDEVRAGVLGFWQNNAESEEGVYITSQVLFDPFVPPLDYRILSFLLRPRPHIGGNVSPAGTDQVFAGLTWHLPVWRSLFAEASFGGTVHNGPIKDAEVALGCHALFRESVAVGVNVGDHWRVIAGIDHSSHAELCSGENDGLTHAGVSVGYRF